ncbi:hypothetical protein DPMN_140944 [Dreissena polymorpha]|uniref:Uncharacterized protein n=1 Tax=Dreissena polymorpha TaxID=45954 RepID=A0A9D4JJG0_DREPO|nr:hypothetical protein DPMN_140944 [Dreissena polymorpha]
MNNVASRVFELARNIINTNVYVPTKFLKDWAIHVACRIYLHWAKHLTPKVFTRITAPPPDNQLFQLTGKKKALVSLKHYNTFAPRPGGDAVQRTRTIFELGDIHLGKMF